MAEGLPKAGEGPDPHNLPCYLPEASFPVEFPFKLKWQHDDSRLSEQISMYSMYNQLMIDNNYGFKW